MANDSLKRAKRAKNDEFYTKIEDIERELIHYKEHFAGKVVFCNCDDPAWSNFYKFFSRKFEDYKLKKLISTHYEEGDRSYKLEIMEDVNGDGKKNQLDEVYTNLEGDGDFRSNECIELLKEADIVVTNPPFSLFREYVTQLIEYDKKFLIIGSKNAITYKETFNLIKSCKLWLGNSNPKEFKQPDGSMKKFGNIGWYTNLKHNKRNEEIILYKKYYENEQNYPKYNNYDIVEVSKVVDIPKDYNGVMGVPITFLDKFNPDQFIVLGIANSARSIGHKCLTIINDRKVYNRILIIRNNNVSKDLYFLESNEFDSFNYSMSYVMEDLESQVRIDRIKDGLITLKKIYQDYIGNSDERIKIFKSIDHILSCKKLGIGEVDSIKLLQIKNKELIKILHRL